jgi:hypothetical protein
MAFWEETYYGLRVMSLLILFLTLAMYVWAITESQKDAVSAYEMGNVVLGDKITKNNQSAVELFSVFPIVLIAAAMVSVFGLK